MSPQPTATARRRAREVAEILAQTFPTAHCALDHSNALELLIATVLSAQCTDRRVNTVTPELFSRYRDAQAYAQAKQEDIEDIIRPTGFFRSKATSIIGIGNKLVKDFGGQVPSTLDELITLPGVGRKTANVVLGNAFNIPGITVDTHVGRIARRLGWSTSTDPVQVESDIAALFPPKEWTEDNEWTWLCHRLIYLGRSICHSRKPACGACPVRSLCPSSHEGVQDPEEAAALIKVQDA